MNCDLTLQTSLGKTASQKLMVHFDEGDVCLGWLWCLMGAELFIFVYTALEAFSNMGPLFPLKDFTGLPTRHVLHSLPY